jgi:protein-ribulosamine 3-kinase
VVIVKRTSYPADLEAEGLRALGAAGAPVPEVLGVEEHTLMLERVGGSSSDHDWEELGAALAGVHRVVADRYGWRRNNVIGPLEQLNTWHDEWPAFFAECRIAPHLAGLPAEVRRRLERALDERLGQLLPPRPPPSLVHGDLWAGNVVGGRWLIDPAVAHCDREYELAFMALFGGISRAMWAAYEEAWPLEDDWQRRRPALQLPHLLVHVRLFGGGYVRPVIDRLDTLGW